jgi:phosphate transport system substrate-binding protein
MTRNIFRGLLVLGILACMTAMGLAQAQSNWGGVSIDGAGATFPFPIYSQWAYSYEEATGLKVNYQSVGSGAGIAAIQAKTVDFGASDAPMTTTDLDKYGLVQFPMVIGGVVPVVNLKGITAGQVGLTADTLSDIYLGKITNWSDPRLVDLNPTLGLPNKAIVVVHRADGSGTTWIFTNYLDKVSPEWHSKIGAGKSVEWPATGVGGRGNEGVANYVGQIDGAIGYVEYAYAKQNHLASTLLTNKSGVYAEPTAEAFSAAASNADWSKAPGYYMVLVDQPGKTTWPITGASFIIMYKDQANQRTARAALEFFDWCFHSGQDAALSLDYVPMPDNVVKMVEDTWHANITSNGTAVW